MKNEIISVFELYADSLSKGDFKTTLHLELLQTGMLATIVLSLPVLFQWQKNQRAIN